jgi:phosphopantothenoylcysteine decarboxylase/phosphopantothenate--cysteine ligase
MSSIMTVHPSKNIIGTKGSQLKGRRIAICITGSVAAVQSPTIARELMRYGAEVFVFMSPMAKNFIHPNLMEWATGNTVVTEITGKLEFISMVEPSSNRVDLILIAPATANTIGKLASGINDTSVTALAMAASGSGIPVIIVPAMHNCLYSQPITERNIAKLKSLGFTFIEPQVAEGKAKVAEVEAIVEATIRALTVKDMTALRVLVTSGPTYEPIDPVRVIANRSSGKMGIALAEDALRRGAEVTLVYGPGVTKPPKGAKIISVETSEQMADAVASELKSSKYDIMIAAAAVADFTPLESLNYKISSDTAQELSINLKPTRKIISEVKALSPETFLVAFKAEWKVSEEELINRSYGRLKDADLDLIVANDVGSKDAGFGSDSNQVYIIDKEKQVTKISLRSKAEIAEKILDAVEKKRKNIS